MTFPNPFHQRKRCIFQRGSERQRERRQAPDEVGHPQHSRGGHHSPGERGEGEEPKHLGPGHQTNLLGILPSCAAATGTRHAPRWRWWPKLPPGGLPWICCHSLPIDAVPGGGILQQLKAIIRGVSCPQSKRGHCQLKYPMINMKH